MPALQGWLGVAAVMCLSAAASVNAQSMLSGRVIAIADGDTLTLLDASKTQHRIRLDGIDAPESGQPFGNRSTQALSDLVIRKEARASCPKTDRYGRQVCQVKVGGVDVGLEQIRRGMAWHFKRYTTEQSSEDRSIYSAAELEARKAKRGLWRDPEPVPPWEWRAARTNSSK